MAKYKVARGNQVAYNSISSKNSDTVYFCKDTGNMYLGSDLLFESNAFINATLDGHNITFTKHGTNGTTTTQVLSLESLISEIEGAMIGIAAGNGISITEGSDGKLVISIKTDGNSITVSDNGVKVSDAYTNSIIGDSSSTAESNTIYGAKAYAKDYADGLIDSLGTAAYKDVDTTITTGSASTNLPTTQAVADFVTTEIGKIDSLTKIVCTNASDTPAGVVWDNQGTTVTGTLVASSNTNRNIYLVPSTNGTKDVYDEYITVKIGSNYSWEKIGNTDVDLSNYVTNDDLVDYVGNANISVSTSASGGEKVLSTTNSKTNSVLRITEGTINGSFSVKVGDNTATSVHVHGVDIEPTGVSSNTTTLPTTAQVKSYVDNAIASDLNWIEY